MSQFLLSFFQTQNGDVPFHCTANAFSDADLDGLRDNLRDVPCEDIFKLVAYADGTESFEWVQVVTDVYISHCKYQVKSHSSSLFSAACAAAIAHRNHFLLCTSRINLNLLILK